MSGSGRRITPVRRPPIEEFALIDLLARRFGRTDPTVIRGIGDDAAIVRDRPGMEWLVTTDLLAEDVHFKLAWSSLEDIGYKAAVANLSDIAAMGGTPRYLLVSIAVPGAMGRRDVQRLYEGLMAVSRRHRVSLIGGDSSASRHGLWLSVTVIGTVPTGRALRRDGARVGDLVYVSGTLGDAHAGLQVLDSNGETGLRPPQRHERLLVARHLRPTPRLKLGQVLAGHRLATAAIDLSDGLSGDLRHICAQSRVGAEIDAGALPISASLRAYAGSRAIDPAALALAGGEDYELLFTVSPRNQTRLERLASREPCPITRIGAITPKSFGLRLRTENGRRRGLPLLSYRHFVS